MCYITRLLLPVLLVAVLGCQITYPPERKLPRPEEGLEMAVGFDGVGRPGSLPTDAVYIHYAGNPVIPGENIYAPSIVPHEGAWFVYYGGWSTRDRFGRDDIYLATTTDPHLRGPYTEYDIVVGRGIYVHANDPSVVKRGGRWVMALTVFGEGRDWVAISISEDGHDWSPREFADRTHEVRISGAQFHDIARPSLIYNEARERWEMYFDGRIEGEQRRGQYLAVSADELPHRLTLVGRVGGFMDADIRRLPDGRYIAAYRNLNEPSPWSIRYAESEDGETFVEHGTFLRPDPVHTYDDAAVSNPGWAIDEDGNVVAVLFGGSEHGLMHHQIGIAYPQLAVQPFQRRLAHNLRQALGPNRQIVFIPEHRRVRQFVLWHSEECPVGHYELPVPLERGRRVRIAPPARPQCLPVQRYTQLHVPTEDVEQYRPHDPHALLSATASSMHSEGLAPHHVLRRGGMWSSEAHEHADAVEWIAIEAPEPVRVAGVTLVPRQRGLGFPIDFNIEYSADGETWRPVAGQQHHDYPNPGSEPQHFGFREPVELRHLRIVATRLSTDQFDNYYFQLSQVQLHPGEVTRGWRARLPRLRSERSD